MPDVPEKYLIEREGPDGTQWYAEDAPGGWTSSWRQADLFTEDEIIGKMQEIDPDLYLAKPLALVEAEQKVNP